MRLTLRTLLAFLDDVLPHAEAQVLQKRIDESEFAATLVQRIRHAVKRLRLSAPKVDGKGIGFDANSVADYLDSVLPTDHMAEFERICLESDVHLAEVAACHQILCKVLKEPAHIEPALRERIHKLPALAKAGQIQRASARHAAPVETAAEPVLAVAKPLEPPVSVAGAAAVKPTSVQPTVTVVKTERPKLEVPDYLKPEPSTSRWQLLGVLGFMGIAAVVLLMMSPLGSQFWSLTSTQVSQNNPPAKPGESPLVNEVPPTDPNSVQPPSPVQPPPLNEQPEQPDGNRLENNAPPMPEGIPPLVAEGPPKKLIPEKPVEPQEAMPPEPKKESEPEKPAPEKSDPEKSDPEKTTPPNNPMTETPAPMPEKEPVGTEVGRYISDETVLARFDSTANTWVRIRPRTLLPSGEKLVSLPVFRPQIALASGMQVTVVGEASWAFDRGENSPVALVAEYGRFVLVTAGVASANIDLQVPGLRGQIALGSADAEAAIEVHNYLPPGEDPATATPVSVVSIFPLSGLVQWKGEDGALVPLKTNSVRALLAGRDPFERSLAKLPAWIDARKTATIDRDAAKTIEPLMPYDRPLLISLEELASHRRVEVRSLAARSLALLDNYQLLFKQLTEEEYKAYWSSQIDALHHQLARGGVVAKELQTQLEKQRGEKDGAVLYRLLWGFSEEQLLSPEGDQLVEFLENIHPDIRLLAFDNLRRITGVTYSYNPAHNPDKNRSALVRWARARKDGEVAYITKPSPLAELQVLFNKADGEK